MAQKPAAKKRTTTSRAGSRPAPHQVKVRRGGRPAGLFTWIAVGVVVIIVVALVIVKVTSNSGGGTGGGASSFEPASPAIVSEVTSVPASVFNTIGVTSTLAPVNAPAVAKGQPLLTATVDGKKLPEVFYLGGEFCPYCAAERWSLIIALSRFGTFTNLGDMSSYSKDAYPNTPTFTFAKATYTSPYLVFKSVEAYRNYLNKAGTYYQTYQKMTAAESANVSKYDTSKYIKGISSGDPIPFINFGNQFFQSTPYSPQVLAGQTRAGIAGALTNTTSPITRAIISAANYQTAAVCGLTGGKPGDVCNSAGVKAAEKKLAAK